MICYVILLQCLCSEYAVKSQLATIDQLNKLTCYDLMAVGYLEKEEQVVKNPVSDRERLGRAHPGRLVEILKKSGAFTRIETSANKFIKTEELNRSKTINKDFVKPLSDKIYSILKESESQVAFKDSASKAIDIYLDSYNIEEEDRDAVKNRILDKELPKIYDQFKKEPKGIKQNIQKVCINVLECCGIISKDRAVKKDILKALKKAENPKDLSLDKEVGKEAGKKTKQSKLQLLSKKIGKNLKKFKAPSKKESNREALIKKPKQTKGRGV